MNAENGEVLESVWIGRTKEMEMKAENGEVLTNLCLPENCSLFPCLIKYKI